MIWLKNPSVDQNFITTRKNVLSDKAIKVIDSYISERREQSGEVLTADASANSDTEKRKLRISNILWINSGDDETWKTVKTPGAKENGVGGKDYSASDGKDPYGFVERYEKSRTEGLAKINGRYSPTGHLLAFRTLHRRMVTRLKHVEYVY